MNIAEFNLEQKKALVDLLIVGMYADRSLSSAEDERVVKLLDSFSFTSDYERQQFSDAAFTRASRQKYSPEDMLAFVGKLAVHFPERNIRKQAHDILEDLITSDGHITSDESELLAATREVFQL